MEAISNPVGPGLDPEACWSICLVDVDVGLQPADVAAAAAAIDHQVREHWFPLWGSRAEVRAATPEQPPRPGEVQVRLLRVPTQEGALAIHDELPDGTPVAHVFPLLCAEEGERWEVAASHEVLELLGDPRLNLMAMLPDGRICALEACDQVQAETYLVGAVPVSNFSTPENFSPPGSQAGIRWDFLGTCSTWFEVRPGGYAQVYDPKTGWTQIGRAAGYRARLMQMGLPTRSGRRRDAAPARRSWWHRLWARLCP